MPIDQFRDEWRTRRFLAMNGDLDWSMLDSDIKTDVIENEGAHRRRDRASSLIWPRSTNGNVSKLPSHGANNNSINVKALARLSTTYDATRIIAPRHTSMQETMAIVFAMANVNVKDRRYRFRIYKMCFIGKELIDVLMEHEFAYTRKECLELALAINQKFKLFEHVKKHHLLKDKVRIG